MVIALDYDGTFTISNEFPKVGTPNPECIRVITNMINRGHKIVLNTLRSGIYLNDSVRLINKCGIDLYGVNNNPDQAKFTKSPKVYADVYIDDCSVGIPKLSDGTLDWKSIENHLISMGF